LEVKLLGRRPSSRARDEAPPERRLELAAELAQVARLQRDLVVARRRYRRELADLGEPPPADGDAPDAELTPDPLAPIEHIKLRTASFDDLRSLGLSITQANRVLERVKAGEVASPDDLERVPGIPRGQLAELKLALSG
jgi:hypothetical protein